MPKLPPRPCTKGGCTKYATKKSRCDDHQVKPWHHNGKSASERGYGKEWRIIRKEALTRDDHLCVMCKAEGVYTPASEVDHIIPKCDGGSDKLSNLQSLCKPHHKQKTLSESNKSKY